MPREKVSDVYSAVNMRREDKERMDAMLEETGMSGVKFMAQIVYERSCKHPARARQMLAATYMRDGEAINIEQTEKIVTLHGFYCKECEKYIFPKPVI